jgi:hypothetical protein
LQIETGEQTVSLGVSADNVLADPAPLLAQQLLEARLQEELRRGTPPKASAGDVRRDWSLLEKAMLKSGGDSMVAESQPRLEPPAWMRNPFHTGGNRP